MNQRPAGQRTCLYNTQQLSAVLDKMALQLAGLLAGTPHILLVGVLRRGAPLAAMLHQRLIKLLPQADITLMNLQVKRYSDDLKLLYPETQLTETAEQVALDLKDKSVVVVDDVLYQGHSMLRAVEYLAGKQADEIRTVVLVDRGVSRLPVHSDVTGVRLDVAPSDIIECNVPPYETEFKIELLQPAE